MSYVYSAEKRGFYHVSLRADYEAAGTWPTDGVQVSQEYREELNAGEALGKRIVPDADGYPVLAEPIPEPQAVALERALVDIRRQRATIMGTLDGISGRMYRKGEIELAQAADDTIEALLDITDLPQLLAAATYDEMKAVVLARYRQIAAAAPDVVKAAFVEAVAP